MAAWSKDLPEPVGTDQNKNRLVSTSLAAGSGAFISTIYSGLPPSSVNLVPRPSTPRFYLIAVEKNRGYGIKSGGGRPGYKVTSSLLERG